MQIQKWVEEWETRVPLTLQEAWDHSGKQFGRFAQPLRGVVFALDFSAGALQKAVEMGANLLVTHHPVLFEGVHTLHEDVPLQNLVMRALEQGIAVYATHTPWDWVDGGVNTEIAERMALRECRALRPREESDPQRAYSAGFGVYGNIEPMTLAAFARNLSQAFSTPSVVFYGEGERKIARVGLLGGSGMDFMPDALAAGCDVFVTADIKYHEAQSAVQNGLALIDLGHYAAEFPSMARAMRLSQSFAPNVPQEVFDEKENKRHSLSGE